jgi:hypothetical protein
MSYVMKFSNQLCLLSKSFDFGNMVNGTLIDKFYGVVCLKYCILISSIVEISHI